MKLIKAFAICFELWFPFILNLLLGGQIHSICFHSVHFDSYISNICMQAQWIHMWVDCVSDVTDVILHPWMMK